jgi:anti-sigma B factor antagonist
VGAHASVTNRGGKVKLLNVQKRLHDLLQITRLYTLFETFDDEATAVMSFSQSAKV